MKMSRKRFVLLGLLVLVFILSFTGYRPCWPNSDFCATIRERRTPETPSVLRDTNERRMELLHDQCNRELQGKGQAAPADGDRILVSEKHSLGYCNVPKVGSTFWFATFAILDGNVTDTTSPEVVLYRLVEDVQKKLGVKYYKRLSSTARKELNQDGKMFLFVRNPYQRILSAYVNKFVSPNAYYWGSFGKQIIADFRHDATSVSRDCGHDVTFAEFLRYIADSGDSDPHWTPINRMCSPCDFSYKFLGKAETFERDATDILRQSNLSGVIKYNPVSDQQVSFYMQAKIAQFLEHYSHVKHCLTFSDLLERLWQTFKAKGYLGLSDEPPVRQLSDVTGDLVKLKAELLDAAFMRYKSLSIDKHMSSVSESYMQHSFSNVDMKTLHKIKQKFWADFALFGYEAEPFVLFERNNVLLYVGAFACLLFIMAIYLIASRKLKIFTTTM